MASRRRLAAYAGLDESGKQLPLARLDGSVGMPVKALERLLSKIEDMNVEIFVAEKQLRMTQEYWYMVRLILDAVTYDLDLPADKKDEALRMRADMEDQLGLLRANLAKLLDIRLALENHYNEQTEALYRRPSLIYPRPIHH